MRGCVLLRGNFLRVVATPQDVQTDDVGNMYVRRSK